MTRDAMSLEELITPSDEDEGRPEDRYAEILESSDSIDDFDSMDPIYREAVAAFKESCGIEIDSLSPLGGIIYETIRISVAAGARQAGRMLAYTGDLTELGTVVAGVC
jgi:hypothetical protein